MSSNNDNRDSMQSHIVADGKERLEAALREEALQRIWAEVTAEYSDRLAAAGFLKKISLRRRIEEEVDRRVEVEVESKMPSRETLY